MAAALARAADASLSDHPSAERERHQHYPGRHELSQHQGRRALRLFPRVSAKRCAKALMDESGNETYL